MINAYTIKPGYLISMKTSIRGNVNYRKTTLEASHYEGSNWVEKWQTDKIVVSPEELELAKKVRSKASSLIRSVCAVTAFGLLCPETKAEQLEETVRKARELVKEFNETAQFTSVAVYAIAGRVASDDAEAMRAINSEVRDLLDDMAEGVKSLDPDAIRTAANKARNIGSMLSEAAQQRVQSAIELARQAARKIVKAGEEAAATVDSELINKLLSARTAFLDLDDSLIGPQTPQETGRALDLMPDGPDESETPSDYDPTCIIAPALDIDMESDNGV